jgi:hypothetical protein
MILTDEEWAVLRPLVERCRPHAQGVTKPFSPRQLLEDFPDEASGPRS